MENVIVTVKYKDKSQSIDLEIPVNVPAAELSGILARVLELDTDCSGKPIFSYIHANPPGRLLEPDETFEAAGVWSGAVITLI